ncbi:E3 ubiquitin-protein ligase RNF8 (RING finger protein 8) (RING-type E3 ubiquitin transferase RNF8) [Durusdinium trenchii]|uniref:E3 ubiquitin-protein ligase CHFR n=1 Tax=Durusdinium trenchii TaxID=1381693 RepID=A0ABP0QEQ8_9DINO
MPNCDIVMDSTRFPQMISRTHARLVTTNVGTPQQEWAIHDCKSMNGVTVNGEAVGVSGRTLRMGDVVNFGKRVVPPEFEFIFEAPQSSGLAEELLVQMKRIADLEQELQKSEKKREAIPKGLKISELSNELACCVCKDWLVHAATIQCSHTFCWSCIDQWLQTKQFVCPVCRKEVTREPVRTRAVDAVVQKTVSQISAEEQAEFAARIKKAEVEDSTSQKHLEDLERQINEALRAGKKFFHINQLWGKKDKETFKKGVNQYPAGNARERYCKLTGMTVQWVHSADSTQLNVALHNVGLGALVDRPEDEIRQRRLPGPENYPACAHLMTLTQKEFDIDPKDYGDELLQVMVRQYFPGKGLRLHADSKEMFQERLRLPHYQGARSGGDSPCGRLGRWPATAADERADADDRGHRAGDRRAGTVPGAGRSLRVGSRGARGFSEPALHHLALV